MTENSRRSPRPDSRRYYFSRRYPNISSSREAKRMGREDENFEGGEQRIKERAVYDDSDQRNRHHYRSCIQNDQQRRQTLNKDAPCP